MSVHANRQDAVSEIPALLNGLPFLDEGFDLLLQLKSTLPVMHQDGLLQQLILDWRWQAVPQNNHRLAQSANDVLVTIRTV